ncbi:MAG: ATP-binding protein [Candidatus Gastranaerophilales bacterium]|nr:ATP-binding protein [Candidatus Gastranaerophilales bacterium]
MNNDFFKNILENIDVPVCISDENENIIFENALFSNEKNVENNSIKIKEIDFDNKKYKLQIIENEQAHQDFISTVSHELRTPLTSIRGFADTMIMSSDKLSKEQQNKFLTIIRNQADRLTRLVENLLEISNMSKKLKLIFKEIDFETFIQPVITIFEKKYPEQNYQVSYDNNLPKIWADSDILEQIMTNLIDNASKYSHQNSTIKINANFYNNEIQIKVIDEADKIPENQLENIFKKFSRIDTPLTRKTEGSGLGLFITKSLTEKMNGKIKAENYENGNIFTLSLPLTNIETQLNSKILGEKE